MAGDRSVLGAGADRERLAVMLSYGLYLLAITNGVTALVGFIVALARREAARGTIYESHYRNLITVFLVLAAFAGLMLAAVLAGVLGLFSFAFSPAPWAALWWFPVPVMMAPLLGLGWLVLGLWSLWRVIGGFIRALEERPY